MKVIAPSAERDFGLIGGFLSYMIKVVLTTALMGALLCVAIMLRYDVSFDFVLHGSDPVIEAKLESFLDFNTIKNEIIDALPMDFLNFLDNFEFLKDILTVKQAANITHEDAQAELYKGLAFGLFSFIIIQIVYFFYRRIRKIANAFSQGFCSTWGGIISFLLIAYISPIISILLRDLAIERLYNKGPFFMILLYALVIVVIFFIEILLNRHQGIKHKANYGKAVGGLVLGALFSVCCIWATLSISTACILNANGDYSFTVILNVIASITLAAVAFVYRQVRC